MLIGRDGEIAVVDAALAQARTASAALLIHGPPGIGKTTLIGHADRTARQHGFRILTARPTRAETALAFAALADLVHGLDLDLLGDTEREALATALGRRPTSGTPPQTHVLGFALVDLLERSAREDAPLAVLVDDVQWIDAASRDVLTFAMRRLPSAGVCLVAGQRVEESVDARAELIDVPEAIELRLAPLSREPMIALLDRVRSGLPVHVVDRIAAAAGGNPLFAIELARAVQPERVRPGEPLPVPKSLGAAVAGHVAACPPATLEALAATALLARPTVGALERLGLLADLAPAEVAGIVVVRGSAIEFTHPLLASAAHDAVPGSARVALHRRLADATSGAERCIHLALATTGTDAVIAAEIAAAAVAERDRGAAREAAELAAFAAAITPPSDPLVWERHLTAAELLFWSGDTDAAVAGIDAVLESPPDATTRARALLTLARIEFTRSDEIASVLAKEALTIASDLELQAAAHSVLAGVSYDDFDAAAEHADQALSLLRESGTSDRLAMSAALQASANARFIAGHGLDRGAYEQAIELEAGLHVPAGDSAFGGLAAMLKYADELSESLQMFTTIIATAGSGSLPFAVGHLTQLHLWAGRWDEAQEAASPRSRAATHPEPCDTSAATTTSPSRCTCASPATVACSATTPRRYLPLATLLARSRWSIDSSAAQRASAGDPGWRSHGGAEPC